MNGKERFYATIAGSKEDRPASWLGIPTNEALPALLEYFSAANMLELKRKINDDIWAVEVPFHCPPANHIACAFDFAPTMDYAERTLTTPGWFMDKVEPACVKDFSWPDPRRHISQEECRNTIRQCPQDMALMGVMWSAHFQDACAAFGMENAMIAMLTEPELFQAVIDRIVEFYIQANEIFYHAGQGMLDAVLIGNDFGSQNALMVAPAQLRQFVFPGTRRLIEQAHSYGYKVIHHSCGAVHEIIADLIELGADVIHPIQALAAGMEPKGLHEEFGEKVAFCGGVDAQNLLVNGTPEQVREKVSELREIFPTGLIISPSHEAILPDIPPANIKAIFDFLKEVSR